jgi:hypothetical protein
MNRDDVLLAAKMSRVVPNMAGVEDEFYFQYVLDFASRIEAATREECEEDAKRYRWLREHSRDPDEEHPYCIRQVYTPFQEQHLVFDERLDNAIDAAIRKS